MKEKKRPPTLPIFQRRRRARVFEGLKLVYNNSHRRATTISLKELEGFPTTKLTDDFKCLEGWTVEGVRWEGIAVSNIISKMSLGPKKRWFLFGAENFTCLLSRRRALQKTTLLATKMNGRRLTSAHGGPLRLLFKGRKCYESIKSVDRIIALEEPRKTTAKQIALSRII
jgi:DMSO/TMAO reductase YedYZ molybdopterin-dependent catalytic subunit